MSKAKDLINSKYIGEAEREHLRQMPPDTEVFGYEDYLKWSKILYGDAESNKLNDASEKYNLEKIKKIFDKEEEEEDMLQIVETLREDRERSIKRARLDEKIEIIKNMLIDNLPIELICKYTGMTEEEIEKLK